MSPRRRRAIPQRRHACHDQADSPDAGDPGAGAIPSSGMGLRGEVRRHPRLGLSPPTAGAPLFPKSPTLRFVGKVGTGFSRATLADLSTRMRALRTDESPFRPVPREASVTWIRPELVAQIAFAEWTADGNLRQPIFLGLRHDKKPSELTWDEREL